MFTKTARALGLILAIVLPSVQGLAQTSPHELYVGTWKGEMNIGRSMPVEFVFERAGNVLKGFVIDPSGGKKPLTQVIGVASGAVFRMDRDESSFMVFTGQLGADKASLAGEVTIMEGKVERGKIPWKARKVVAAQPALPTTPGGPPRVQTAEERGRNLFAKKDYAGAITAYTECLKSGQPNQFCLVGRALSFHRTGKYKEAIADFDVSIKANPKPPAQAFLNRAESKLAMEDYDGAIADADLAYAVDRTVDAHLKRGEAFQRKGGLIHFDALMRGQDSKTKGLEIAAKGLVEFNTFIQLKPQDHRGYWLRGVHYYQLWNLFNDDTRLKDGLADLDKAVGLSPQNADILYSRYEIHKVLGNQAAAAADHAKHKELSRK